MIWGGKSTSVIYDMEIWERQAVWNTNVCVQKVVLEERDKNRRWNNVACVWLEKVTLVLVNAACTDIVCAADSPFWMKKDT